MTTYTGDWIQFKPKFVRFMLSICVERVHVILVFGVSWSVHSSAIMFGSCLVRDKYAYPYIHVYTTEYDPYRLGGKPHQLITR